MISLLLTFACSPLPALAVPASVAVGTHPTGTFKVQWRGKGYALEDIPQELGVGPPAAVEVWIDWATAHDYQMNLNDDGRVLVVSPKGNGKLRRQLKLVKETSELFDKLLPAPPRKEPEPEPEPELEEPDEPAEGEIPEDPEGGRVGWLPASEDVIETYTYEWGAGTWPVDTETCVLFVVRDEKDYGSLLEELANEQDYLKPWISTARKLTGFALERPLAAAYIENAAGMEEWDPDNEVVNRVAQMLLVRRFSQQPYWLVQGLAWHVEFAIRGGIYCFPYRAEFIYATEHTGWPAELKSRFSGRKDRPLEMDEFAEWQRGRYDGKIAKVAYGLAGFFANYHPDQFSPFLEDMRLHAHENNRVDNGDGTWERKTDYRITTEDQKRFLKQHFGRDVLKEASEYFRVGKRYRP